MDSRAHSAVQHVPLCLCSWLAEKMLITCVMRNARAHKLQWSGPTVHSFTVVLRKTWTTVFFYQNMIQYAQQWRRMGAVFLWKFPEKRKPFLGSGSRVWGYNIAFQTEFFTNSDAILNFVHNCNACHCLSRVIQVFFKGLLAHNSIAGFCYCLHFVLLCQILKMMSKNLCLLRISKNRHSPGFALVIALLLDGL